jgi:hypothetical protein
MKFLLKFLLGWEEKVALLHGLLFHPYPDIVNKKGRRTAEALCKGGESGHSWFLQKWRESNIQGPLNICSFPLLNRRAFFLLFHERVSCFLSFIVLYWRWQALELAFLTLVAMCTCRKGKFLWVRKLRLPDKRNVPQTYCKVPSIKS